MKWTAILRYIVTPDGCYSAMGETLTVELISNCDGTFGIAIDRYVKGHMTGDRMKRIEERLSKCTISMMIVGVGSPKNVLASCKLTSILFEPQNPILNPFDYSGKLSPYFYARKLQYCY